jgi:hypothetical protein
MTQSPVTIVRVSATELRSRFNDGRYWERTQAGGDLIAIVEADRHPALPLANEPYCTKSQQVSYRQKSTNTEVARVHQYLRTGGQLGLSGKPDPKRLFEDGVLYRLKTAKQLDQGSR